MVAYPDGRMGLKLPDAEIEVLDTAAFEAKLAPIVAQQGGEMRVMVAAEGQGALPGGADRDGRAEEGEGQERQPADRIRWQCTLRLPRAVAALPDEGYGKAVAYAIGLHVLLALLLLVSSWFSWEHEPNPRGRPAGDGCLA